MRMKLKIEALPKTEHFVETFEYKGAGNADILATSLAEKAENALKRYYSKNFKKGGHCNLGCVILPGKANVAFSGGMVEEPVRVLISGKAVKSMGNVQVPVESVIKDAVKSHLNQFKEFKSYETKIEVCEGVKQSVGKVVKSSQFPLTKLQEKVMKVGNYINSDRFRRKYLGVGYDNKIFGVREGDSIKLDVDIAFISKYVKNMESYMKVKQGIKKDLWERFNVNVDLNQKDNYESLKGIGLTVSGFGCESVASGVSSKVDSIETMARALVNKGGLQGVDVSVVFDDDEPCLVHVKARGKIDTDKVSRVVKESL